MLYVVNYLVTFFPIHLSIQATPLMLDNDAIHFAQTKRHALLKSKKSSKQRFLFYAIQKK